MPHIGPDRINVWIYKFLLGTLSPEKTKLLKRGLELRNEENQINSALEQKLLAAITSDQTDEQKRKHAAELLDDWEKRNWGD